MPEEINLKNIGPIIKELRRPYMPEAVRTKIQTATQKGALVVSYIDARHVAERLNIVCPNEWSDDYNVISNNGNILAVECHLSINDVTRSDVGTGEIDERMGGLKILWSDSFKRAAVKFGIGAFLYALPTSFITSEHLTGTAPKYRIPEKTNDLLRKKYKKWLSDIGRLTFGEPYDHGDKLMSQGDIETDE